MSGDSRLDVIFADESSKPEVINWELEEKRIDLSFWVIRKLVKNIMMKMYWNIRCQYFEPRYDRIYIEGIRWLDSL